MNRRKSNPQSMNDTRLTGNVSNSSAIGTSNNIKTSNHPNEGISTLDSG